MKKGVTLMAVIAIVIVISILSLTVAISGVNIMQDVNKRSFATMLTLAEEAYRNLGETKEDIAFRKKISVNVTSLTAAQRNEYFPGEVVTSNKIALRYIDASELDTNITIGTGKEGATDIFALSETTGRIYYVKGKDFGDKKYFYLNDELKKLIGIKSTKATEELKDGIIVKLSNRKPTRGPLEAEVLVPAKYTSTTVNYNGAALTLKKQTVDAVEYNVAKVLNINVNGDINISYSGKTLKYKISNIDNASPVISHDGVITRVVGNGQETYITNVVAKDGEGKITKLKFETEKIEEKDAKMYFSTNGIRVKEARIRVLYPGNDYTIYAEDEAGNYQVKYVSASETGLSLMDFIPIYTPEDFAKIGSGVSKDVYDLNGRKVGNFNFTLKGTYKLMNDLDFTNKVFDQIQNFSGILDGNNHRIINYKKEIGSSTGTPSMFMVLSAGEIKNLVISNATVKSKESASILAGSVMDSTKLTNITLENFNITAGNKIGGLFTYAVSTGREKPTIRDCKVITNSTNNFTLVSGGNESLVGLLGADCNGAVITNCTVTNAANINPTAVKNGFVSTCIASAKATTFNNVNVTNSGTVEAYLGKCGGILGYTTEANTLQDCTLKGAGTLVGSHVGGIIANDFGSKVTFCANYSKVKGDTSTGGILGYGYQSEIGNCENYGEIHGTGMKKQICGDGYVTTINCIENGKIY